MNDSRWLRHAARLALRGHGGAEPNPLVGCVIIGRRVEPGGAVREMLLGEGHHARCGCLHAERVALEDVRRRGGDPRAATLYVTLAPCCGSGRTPPCTEAIIEAGIARVVIAREDPHPKGRDALAVLAAGGIETSIIPEPSAVAVAEPFVHRVEQGLPWVVAKWAQTIDGRVATRVGESRWISGERSRAMVHRERGRVDAVLTGIGTVLADDPLLTARGVRRRRLARRIVIDPRLRIPMESKLVATARDVPLIVACAADRIESDGAGALRACGVELRALEGSGDPLTPLLRQLVREGASTLLVESGPRLLGALLREDLICEAWTFTSGRMIGDDHALPSVGGPARASDLSVAPRFTLVDLRRRGADVMALWRRQR